MIPRRHRRAGVPVVLLSGLLLGGCAGAKPAAAPAPAHSATSATIPTTTDATRTTPHPRPLPPPIAPPEVAFRQGWMPLASTGVERFRRAHDSWDGRGVLIAILDSGIDPGVEGLARTSTGEPKLVDLRDFSGEGRILLSRIAPRGDTALVAGRRLAGFSRVRTIDHDGPWYAGVLAELPLGDTTAADVNANGSVTDSLPVIVTRATDGWVMLADTDGDGSLSGEKPVHDYLVAHETFGWTSTKEPPRLLLAANFRERGAEPELDLHFDTSGHGTHVAGIAAGHDMYGVAGFDGVAPGAQLVSCKIADDAQGAVTTTGSMVRALEYAVRLARSRNVPLVVNVSFGVNNELEGTARIDALVDSVLGANPDVVLATSAGNEGPGLSTIGFPASARRVISVGAVFPGIFLAGPGGPPPADALADFSSRGGEVAGPHVVAPGVAYSTVPRWDRGGEREGGTSMASPHAAGLAALLLSAAAQSGFRPTAHTVRQALMATAQPLPGTAAVDDGAGLADVGRAWSWLARRPTVPVLEARSLARGELDGAFLVLDRPGADTLRRFVLRQDGGTPVAIRFRSSAPWLMAPASVSVGDSSVVQLAVKAAALKQAGTYAATLSGWTSDTLLGAVVRIPVTVIVPHRGDFTLREARVPTGGWLRIPILVEKDRPFSAQVSGREDAMALAYLHEPGGRAYRAQHVLPIGSDDGAALFDVESSDVVPGVYELVVQGSQLASAAVTIEVRHSPVRLGLARAGDAITAEVSSASRAELPVQAIGAIIGGWRRETVTGRGSTPVRLPFDVPSWARVMQVQVAMAPAAWADFTDFGLTLFDPVGRQLQVEPIESAVSRLQHEFSPGGTLEQAVLGFFPAFAEPGSDAEWKLDVTISFVTDSARKLEPVRSDMARVQPGAPTRIEFRMPSDTFPMTAPLVPLAFLAVRSGDDVWITQAPLPPGASR